MCQSNRLGFFCWIDIERERNLPFVYSSSHLTCSKYSFRKKRRTKKNSLRARIYIINDSVTYLVLSPPPPIFKVGIEINFFHFLITVITKTDS